MNTTTLFYSALVLVLTLISLTYAKVAEMDHVRNTKRFEVTIVGAFITAFIGWYLATFYFTEHPEYVTQFVLAVLFLFVLPVTLFSTSVATITSSN